MGETAFDFYRNKRVFITGHTGFKGTWLSAVLHMAGAEVTGFALPPDNPSLWDIAGQKEGITSVYGDICNFLALKAAFQTANPEIVFHLAAQPIVRTGYQDPAGTYSANVMGTVHLLECARQSDCVQSVLNVTTDKVYENQGCSRGYQETDSLKGYDPYSSSKACSELVTDSYRKSFFSDRPLAVSTARAGNVIGGGDFAADRIVPDCVRAVQSGSPVQLRNPSFVRPYQYVLEALTAYLLIAQRQYENRALAGSYNVGPDSDDCLTTGELADLFCRIWGDGASWKHMEESGPHEDMAIRLDCSKIRTVLGWKPKWKIVKAMEETVAWSKAWLAGQDMSAFMEQQIRTYLNS